MKKSTSKIKNVPVDVYNFTTLKDLIQAAMGPPDKNIVNFKMVQAILMILARQLRMLERPVDYRSLKEDKTDRIERENAEREGREGDKGARVRDKSERESEKSEREGEKLERESEESEEDAEKKERGGGKGERDRGKREKAERDRGKREKSERDGGKVEKSEIRSKKSEKDKRKGETVREGEKAGREGGERDKAERDRKEGEQAKKDGEKLERDSGEGENAETESEKSDGHTGEAEKEGDKSERDGEKEDKTERATEKSKKDRGTGKKSEKASKPAERDRGKGKKGEKERQKSERDEGEAEKAERVSEISESDAGEEEEAERKSDSSEREIDSSEIGSQRLDTESGKSQRESEKEGKIRKKEQEREKAAQKKVKPGRLKEKTVQEKEKTGQEKEKKGKEEREKTGRDKKGKKAVEEKPAIEESFISITDKDQVLVVEKIPTSRRGASQTRVGSIPVVTLSQFHILETAVKALQQLASPIPLPSMPDNSTLRDELAKGSANLTDTMNAMQVSARVQAAEEAINRMAELLTDMAGKSGMPTDMEGQMPSLTGKSASKKHATSTTKGVVLAKGKGTLKGAKMEGKESKRSMASMAKGPPEAAPVFVTHPQLNEALRVLKEGLSQSANNMTTSANKIAEHSRTTVISAAEKAALVSHMDARIKSLTQEVNEQSELLASTDASVVTQIDAYNSQLGLVKGELKKIVEQFVTLDTNKETQAVKELNGRFEKLVEMLDVTMESNKHLIARHNDLNSDMQSVLNCIEMLQEEKSDRDEMMDRLRDKADISSLDSLLPAEQFAVQQEILNKKLGQCHGKFSRQESVWHDALHEMSELIDEKSDYLQLIQLKEDTEKQLDDINKKLRCLAYVLGEPKAALLARKLSVEARCGACKKPAIQNALDDSYMMDSKNEPFKKPRRLPLAFFSYLGAGDPCDVATNAPTKEEARQHACHRWVGGSHTLINPSVKRTKAKTLQPIEKPMKKYTDCGDDGKLYNLDKPLDPCEYCNSPDDDKVRVDGAGDKDFIVHGHIIEGSQNAAK